MKLHVLSDLHNGFSQFEPSPIDCDLVILAGDIDVGSKGVEWANTRFTCPVLYACGNHEFYGGHLERTLRKMKESASSNVHVLENEVFIWNQTRFLVTTSWTDFSLSGDPAAAAKVASEWMNDFRMIRVESNYRRLRPEDLINRSRSARAWLLQELEKRFDGKTVVVTHHAPTPEKLGDKHDGHLNAAYANNWPDLLNMADVWVYGHTHCAADFYSGRCRVVSNPRGYPGEQTGFDPGFVLNLS